MTGVGMVLKAFGLEIPPEAIEKLNKIVPQLPDLVQEIVEKNNAALQATKHYVESVLQRLDRLEAQNAEILELLRLQNGNATKRITANGRTD